MKLINPALAALCLLVPLAWGQPELRLKARVAPGRSGRPVGRTAGGTHYIVQFRAEPGTAEREELEQRGMRVLQYVPDAALMVASPTTPDLQGLDVLSVSTLSGSDKISPVLRELVSGALLVVFHADVMAGAARGVVRDLGFEVVENPSVLPGQLVVTGAHRGIAALAEQDEVAYILPASPELAAGVPQAGCAGAATVVGPVGEYVLVSSGWAKDAAGKVALQYFIRSLTEKLDAATARSEIERAMREWTRYANFTLTAGSQQGASRTIDILFARGNHGDGYPFDGPGGVLAHTFYPTPPNSEPIAGDMHLDGDEGWSVGGSVDLYSVALHETGHALGLGHSDRPGSVMYPYYHLSTGLTDDDIAGIQALYGTNVTPPPAAPSPTPTPTPTPTPAPTPTPPPPPPPSPAPPAGDTIPPTLEIDSPGFTIGSTTASSITVSGKSGDNVGVNSVKWTNSSGFSGVAVGTTTWSASVPLLVGTNVVTVRAYDAAGNSGWRSVTVVRF
jgi:Matrixin/Glucodextranase, domain B